MAGPASTRMAADLREPDLAWPIWLNGLEHRFLNPRVVSLISDQGHIPGLQVQSLPGQETTYYRCVSVTEMFLSL